MNTNDILLEFEYNRWATARLLNAASVLSHEQFCRDVGGSYTSVRDTLVHILAGEEVWLMRWKGISPKSASEPSDFSDLLSLKSKWSEVEIDQSNFLSKISDESLAERVEYENFAGEIKEYSLWQMIHHMVNHSTYHRGQVTMMLRQLGAAAAQLDYIVFLDSLATPVMK